MSRRFTHKNRVSNPQRHKEPLRSYKTLFYLYTSGFLRNPRIKRTWVIYEKDKRYSKLIFNRWLLNFKSIEQKPINNRNH